MSKALKDLVVQIIKSGLIMLSSVLFIAGWALAFRWGYITGRDEWRGNFDACMKAKTKAIKDSACKSLPHSLRKKLSQSTPMRL